MPLNLRLSSCPAKEETPGLMTLIITQDVLPTRFLEVSNLREAVEARAAYAKECEATGQPAAVFMGQRNGCRARKFPGFDKAARERVYVNA